MDVIKNFFEALFNSAHYSYGWLVLAILSILPAIVSGNLIQHDLSKFITGKINLNQVAKPLLFNLIIFLVCICVMAYTFYLYIWI